MNITTDEKILRKQCMPVMKEKADYMNNLINNMIRLMITNQGCGIACPQVEVNKRMFVAILDNERIEVFINPVITTHSTETIEDEEECLSVPNRCGIVERYKSITVKYFNGNKLVTKEYTDMNARIIQHEYDHLQGVLYTDKAREIKIVEKSA